MYSIGIDIGGSKISLVLLKDLKILKKQKISTPSNNLIQVLEENIKKLDCDTAGIGIGIPGAIDPKRKLILHTPNILELSNCKLKLKRKCVIENDANCFTLGEAVLGAGKGEKIILGITIGSGIGGGIVYKKNNAYKIHKGIFGSAGEIGHMIIERKGVKCSCGNHGCLEEYASKKFIKRKTSLTGKELKISARKGDKKAEKIIQEMGVNLGIGLGNAINLLGPSAVIVGGGLSNFGEMILSPARHEAKKNILSPFSQKYVKIKKAKLGDWGGAIGAALLISHNYD